MFQCENCENITEGIDRYVHRTD